MAKYKKEDIFRMVEEEDVEFIRLQFTDMFGMLKNVAITAGQLEKALNNRCVFDGSAIEGFVREEETDMYLHPDLDTFTIFPWRPQQGKVARLVCDVYGPDGTPFEGDPRYILKKVLKEAEESLSTDTHELIETSTETTEATSKDKEFVMENENVFVRINLDGSFDLTDKKTGHTFENCGIYEDTGDMGNEYIYIQDTDRQTITTRNIPATIFVGENSAIRSVVKVRHELEVPEAIGDEILPQRYSCVDLYQRKAKRSEKLVKLSIETTLTLEHHAKGVKAQTTVVNTAKDHRLRVLFPAGLDSDMHFADSTFEVVRRPNRHGKAWTNPSACEHEQCFVAMEDKNAGILVANRGLYEYEILPDEENTIALTLLRSVAEMGDWGYFPTPQAQMQGSYTVEYAIFPYEPEMCAEAFALGYDYQHDLACVQLGMNREKETIFTPQAQSGILPIRKSFFEWEGNGLNLTAFKKGANSEDIFVRFVNTLETDVKLTIKKADWMKGIYQSSVIEEKKETLGEENGVFSVVVKPYQIVTFGLQPKER